MSNFGVFLNTNQRESGLTRRDLFYGYAPIIKITDCPWMCTSYDIEDMIKVANLGIEKVANTFGAHTVFEEGRFPREGVKFDTNLTFAQLKARTPVEVVEPELDLVLLSLEVISADEAASDADEVINSWKDIF